MPQPIGTRPPMYEYDRTRYEDIAGNASNEAKQQVCDILSSFMRRGSGFADGIGGRLKIEEISCLKKAEEPERLEGKVVCEIDVEEDMVNGAGNVHGACSAYLVDLCSTLPIIALLVETNKRGVGGVSQALDVVYHSPAVVGDRLRVISTTITLGARTMSARCEIWNKTKHRLVASGVHIKMEPSAGPKL